MEYYYDYVVVDTYCAPDRTVQECYNEPTVVETCSYSYRWEEYRCTYRTVTRRVCDTVVIPGDCTDIYELQETYTEVCPAGEVYSQIGTDNLCDPDGFTNVPVYACCQAGSYSVCDETATGITYTNYYYLQVVKMVDGVFSVVDSIQVPDRWSAVKITGNSTTLTVDAYTDSLYANKIGTYTTSAFLATGTGYGVVARASNFEDGRSIGSLIVKPLGQ